jgi:hypothetical protein
VSVPPQARCERATRGRDVRLSTPIQKSVQYSAMKTTLDIEDDLLAAVKVMNGRLVTLDRSFSRLLAKGELTLLQS